MPNYRRNFIPGATYFFTVVMHRRRPILTDEKSRYLLRRAIAEVKAKRPFDMIACVLLPDHLHAVLALPPGDSDYPIRWGQIKEAFSRNYLKTGGTEGIPSASRSNNRERAVWQRRFWEHTCRDEDDLKRCVDYVHWNPVKHGLVSSVKAYPWSTFHKFVHEGEYDPDWWRDVAFPVIIGSGWD